MPADRFLVLIWLNINSRRNMVKVHDMCQKMIFLYLSGSWANAQTHQSICCLRSNSMIVQKSPEQKLDLLLFCILYWDINLSCYLRCVLKFISIYTQSKWKVTSIEISIVRKIYNTALWLLLCSCCLSTTSWFWEIIWLHEPWNYDSCDALAFDVFRSF